VETDHWEKAAERSGRRLRFAGADLDDARHRLIFSSPTAPEQKENKQRRTDKQRSEKGGTEKRKEKKRRRKEGGVFLCVSFS
jgi:hypothetical protein